MPPGHHSPAREPAGRVRSCPRCHRCWDVTGSVPGAGSTTHSGFFRPYSVRPGPVAPTRFAGLSGPPKQAWLSLLTAVQGGLCLSLQEECRSYAGLGVAQETLTLTQSQDGVTHRREALQRTWWDSLSQWVPWFAPVLCSPSQEPSVLAYLMPLLGLSLPRSDSTYSLLTTAPWKTKMIPSHLGV